MTESRLAKSARWRWLRRLLPPWYRPRWEAAFLRAHIDRAGGEASARGTRFWLYLTWDVVLTTASTRWAGGPKTAGIHQHAQDGPSCPSEEANGSAAARFPTGGDYHGLASVGPGHFVTVWSGVRDGSFRLLSRSIRVSP